MRKAMYENDGIDEQKQIPMTTTAQDVTLTAEQIEKVAAGKGYRLVVAELEVDFDISDLARAFLEQRTELAALTVERDCARDNNALFQQSNLNMTDQIIDLKAELAKATVEAHDHYQPQIDNGIRMINDLTAQLAATERAYIEALGVADGGGQR